MFHAHGDYLIAFVNRDCLLCKIYFLVRIILLQGWKAAFYSLLQIFVCVTLNSYRSDPQLLIVIFKSFQRYFSLETYLDLYLPLI